MEALGSPFKPTMSNCGKYPGEDDMRRPLWQARLWCSGVAVVHSADPRNGDNLAFGLSPDFTRIGRVGEVMLLAFSCRGG